MFDPRPLDSPAPPPGEVDALLAQMAADGQEDLKMAPATVGAKPPKLRYSHKAMADTLIQNPWMTQAELAQMFGRTQAWISVIVTSDAFQAYYASRQEELLDPELRISLRERFVAVTTQSLKVLQEKLSKPAAEVSENLALRAMEIGAKSLGMGVAPPPAAPVDGAKHLNELAERLLRLGGRAQMQPIEDAVVIGEG